MLCGRELYKTPAATAIMIMIMIMIMIIISCENTMFPHV